MRYLLHKVALQGRGDIIHAGGGSGLLSGGPCEAGEGTEAWSEVEGVLTSILHGRTGLNIKPLPALNSPASFGGSERKVTEGMMGCV